MVKYLFFLAIAFSACQPAPMHPNDPQHREPATTESYEVYRGDTCNRLDKNGKKQGKWYTISEGKIKDTLYYSDGKITDK